MNAVLNIRNAGVSDAIFYNKLHDLCRAASNHLRRFCVDVRLGDLAPKKRPATPAGLSVVVYQALWCQDLRPPCHQP